ncbi:hypothetical protein B0J11DRAFT_38597 [Dendryphion nanum]|uniref:Uncharacterized protein n=1 Tax=Dendryphion nanum TaxID=256645 RepID=A0A9P9J216_9PLEO|nr:hypothetical protein B0J11DRAFT_38597 [Dendryphion nanum]
MKTSATPFLLFAPLIAALPTANLAVRAPGDVLICTGENYTGDCQTLSVPYNTCQTLSAPFYKNVGSIKPDAGAFCRITYSAETCTSHGDAFIDPTPGAPTLRHFTNVNGEVIDAGSQITSFLCQECTACS